MIVKTCDDIVESLQVARTRTVLAQRVEYLCEHLAPLTFWIAKEGLLRECSWDIQRYLALVPQVPILALHSLVQSHRLQVAHRQVCLVLYIF